MAPLPAALNNDRGQSMIESLALCVAFTAILLVMLAVLYFGFVHVGANYLAHELLVCHATQGESRCEEQFRKRAKSFLFAGKILRLESRRGFSSERVRLVLQMPLGKTLTLTKELPGL